jgi:putative hydrolase of the HAD superfamily
MHIRAVIFDYGMVLSAPPDQQARANLIALTGLTSVDFDRHYWTHRLAYDLGHLDGSTYWPRFAEDAGIRITPEEIDSLIENDVMMWTSINEPMLAWAGQLQEAGIRTAILSNMGAEVLRYMRQEFSWLGTFDHHTWSCELGIAKPDPAIYTHAVKSLGVPPQEALFLDDREENIRGAESVGLHGILFRDVAQLNRDLLEQGLADQLPRPGPSGTQRPGNLASVANT